MRTMTTPTSVVLKTQRPYWVSVKRKSRFRSVGASLKMSGLLPSV
jgi:hypothetical protein